MLSKYDQFKCQFKRARLKKIVLIIATLKKTKYKEYRMKLL